MSHLRHFRHVVTTLAIVAAALLTAPAASAQRYPALDPVAELRQSLAFQLGDEGNLPALKYREDTLNERIAALKTLSELRRALSLTEWKDMPGAAPKPIRAIDQAARRKVGQRFLAEVRAVVEKGIAIDRLAVAKMLGEMGTEVRPLSNKEETEVLGFGRAIAPFLIQLTKDRDPAVRSAAAIALGKVFPDPQQAGAALQAVLKTDAVPQRRAAAQGLVNLIQRVTDLFKAGRTQTGIEIGRRDVIDAAHAIAEASGLGLADRDAGVRALTIDAVLRSLQAFRDQAPDPYPVNSFPPPGRKEWTPQERDEVLKARKRFQLDLDEFTPLMQALRKRADDFARLLSDPDALVRLDARKSLEMIGEVRERLKRRAASIPPLPGAVGAGQGVIPVAQKVEPGKEDLLGQALEPGLLVVARGLRDPNPRIRLAAVEFLETMESGAGVAVPVLLEALCDPNRFVRWAAVRAFGRINLADLGPGRVEAVVPAVGKLMNDRDVDVSRQAASTLQIYGPQGAAAIPDLARATAEGDPEVRVAAMKAMSAMGADAAPAMPALIQALGNADGDVRRYAAETLGRIGPAAREGVPALRRALYDDNPRVRQAASDAILSIYPPPATGAEK